MSTIPQHLGKINSKDDETHAQLMYQMNTEHFLLFVEFCGFAQFSVI